MLAYGLLRLECARLHASPRIVADVLAGTAAGKTCRYRNETAGASRYSFRNILPKAAAVVPLQLAPEESPYVRCSDPGNESRYLQFFMEKTIPDFLPMFPESAWRTRVLQVAHVEPSIRHALISLASSHEWLLDPSNRKGPSRESELSSRHYGLALGYLKDDPAFQHKQKHKRRFIHINVCSCLLFMCREVRVASPKATRSRNHPPLLINCYRD